MDDRDVDFWERERALTFIVLVVIYFDGLLIGILLADSRDSWPALPPSIPSSLQIF